MNFRNNSYSNDALNTFAQILDMQIVKNKVVEIDYTLRDEENKVMDSSEGKQPLAYIHGVGQLIPGLESELDGKVKGDSLKASIEPKDGYGERDDSLVAQVPKDNFQGDNDPTVGMQVRVETNEGARLANIVGIEDDKVTLDLNHPLAGAHLNFEVEVKNVRDASEQELEQGQVAQQG